MRSTNVLTYLLTYVNACRKISTHWHTASKCLVTRPMLLWCHRWKNWKKNWVGLLRSVEHSVDWWNLLRYSIELGRVEMARASPGQSHHVIDRSRRIGLDRGKRTVKVIAYRLFYSPAKTCVTQRQTTLTDNALQFSTLQISASSNANPIYLSWKKNNTWTADWMIWLTVLRSCIAKGTGNLQPPQRY